MGLVSSQSAWLCGCVLLLFVGVLQQHPKLLVAFQAPVLYTLVALLPTAALLRCTAGQAAVPAAAAPKMTEVEKSNADSIVAQLGVGGMTDVLKRSIRQEQPCSPRSTAMCQLTPTAAAPASRPQADCAGAAASQDKFTSMSILGSSSVGFSPCGVSCSSNNCPWHLPMAPSLTTWGQESSSRTSGSRRSSGSTGMRPSCTDDQLSSRAAHAAADLQAFSFDSIARDSTGAAPGRLVLLRSLSAPAAPAGPAVEFAGLSGVWAAQDIATGAALEAAASKLSMADACAAAAMQQLRLSLQLQDTKMPAVPGPFWVYRRAAGAAVLQQDDASQEIVAAAKSAAVLRGLQEHVAPAAVASVRHTVCPAPRQSPTQQQVQDTAGQQAQAEGQPQVQMQALVQDTAVQQQAQPQPQAQTPVRLQVQAPLQVQDTAGEQSLQAQGHADSEILVMQHAPGLQVSQHLLGAEQKAAHLQRCAEHQQLQMDPQLYRQQVVLNSPATPLPFIATTNRHSMCMRQPSFRLHAAGSPLSASLSSGGFAASAPPLPSPAESPLARRLSDRDDTGLPTSTPALQELLASGASRRQLRRGCSLDSRRSVSSPGSHSCGSSPPVQQQPQQETGPLEVPWAGMRHPLRSVAHLVQQHQQQLRQRHHQEAQQVDGSPWYRRYQLERRETISTAAELSVTADGTAVPVDVGAVVEAAAAAVFAANVAPIGEAAVAAAAAAAAVAAVDAAADTEAAAAVAEVCSNSSSSLPPQSQLMWSSNGSGSSSGADGVVSPSVASVGRLTSHRLSCCSALSDTESESEAAECEVADATAAVLCSSDAGREQRGVQATPGDRHCGLTAIAAGAAGGGCIG